MRQTRSLRSRSIAVALAMAVLAWPAVSDAQLGGLLPLPPTTTTSTVAGPASAARVSVLGILGTATTTALAGPGTLSGGNDTRVASMVAGGVSSTINAESLHAATNRWCDQGDDA